MTKYSILAISNAIHSANISVDDLLAMPEEERNELLNAIAVIRKFAGTVSAEATNGKALPFTPRGNRSVMHTSYEVLSQSPEPMAVSQIHHALMCRGFKFNSEDENKQRKAIGEAISRDRRVRNVGSGLWCVIPTQEVLDTP